MKKVVIMRGISGAGKDTYANKIINEWKASSSNSEQQTFKINWRIFSADLYFMDSKHGGYNFIPSEIGDAHLFCYSSFQAAMSKHHEFSNLLFFVCNTNISAYEISPYIMLANYYQFSHEIITILCDPAVAHARNVHGVPEDVVWNMHKRLLKEELPPFWNQKVVFSN